MTLKGPLIETKLSPIAKKYLYLLWLHKMNPCLLFISQLTGRSSLFSANFMQAGVKKLHSVYFFVKDMAYFSPSHRKLCWTHCCFEWTCSRGPSPCAEVDSHHVGILWRRRDKSKIFRRPNGLDCFWFGLSAFQADLWRLSRQPRVDWILAACEAVNTSAWMNGSWEEPLLKRIEGNQTVILLLKETGERSRLRYLKSAIFFSNFSAWLTSRSTWGLWW